jgi:hypothetical protein
VRNHSNFLLNFRSTAIYLLFDALVNFIFLISKKNSIMATLPTEAGLAFLIILHAKILGNHSCIPYHDSYIIYFICVLPRHAPHQFLPKQIRVRQGTSCRGTPCVSSTTARSERSLRLPLRLFITAACNHAYFLHTIA